MFDDLTGSWRWDPWNMLHQLQAVVNGHTEGDSYIVCFNQVPSELYSAIRGLTPVHKIK